MHCFHERFVEHSNAHDKEKTMNTAINNQNSTTKLFDEAPANSSYRPRLTFYHANGKGSGSAAQFEVVPAAGDRSGAVYMTLARQNSVAGVNDDGKRQYASFDWQNKVIAKLNFNDLCQMLLVSSGKNKTIADGKGLYHDSRNKTTIINVTRQTEPFPGLVLEVSRKDKDGDHDPIRVRIVLNDAETYGLGAVLEQSLSVVAFGIHRKSRQFTASAHPETEQPAI
jgi:hypothetical protein